MPITDIAAVLLGLGIASAVALMARGVVGSTDESMRWEGAVAVGFSALILIGPLWLAQAVCTVISTIHDGGISPWWLWVWLFTAPALGVLLAPALNRLRASRSELPSEAGRVQFLADQAWADTAAAPGWQLRRTLPLPQAWPPQPGGPVIWFCYAERENTPQTVEIAAPWARIETTAGEAVLHRLSDRVVPLGLQGIQPLSADVLRKQTPRVSLVSAVQEGDPKGLLANVLAQWRTENSLIAAHPAVADRLPPLDFRTR